MNVHDDTCRSLYAGNLNGLENSVGDNPCDCDAGPEAALAAMAAAEAEAADAVRWATANGQAASVLACWANDRLRLIARDRAALERHASVEVVGLVGRPDMCPRCVCSPPCPDAQAVIDYWTRP